MRKTYRKDSFRELNVQILIIGILFIVALGIGAYLNKIWPNYQHIIIDNINPSIEYYSDSSLGIKETVMSNLKVDTIFMVSIALLSIFVVTFPITVLVIMLKGMSIGYTINSIILTLKLKSFKMVGITLLKNIIIVPGAIILVLISFNYFKEVMYEFKKGKKDNILFLLKRYLLNVIIVVAITLGLQLALNALSVSIIKFLVR